LVFIQRLEDFACSPHAPDDSSNRFENQQDDLYNSKIMPTLPKADDFPPSLAAIIHFPPDSQPSNVLIHLPGLGDTASNFASFARALNFPDTVNIILQPPFPLPFPAGPGFHWSDDLVVDTSTGALDAESSPLTQAISLVGQVVDTLRDKCGFTARQIHLLGYGQGGSVGLGLGAATASELGGVVSIGGPLPLNSSINTATSRKPPVLLLGGRGGAFGHDEQSSPVKRVRQSFAFVEAALWKRRDDSLPKSRDEALPLMRFFARRLRSRRGVPEGAVEV
jgi:predicted esterase